jgi:Domain of unknown function (DUF4252)
MKTTRKNQRWPNLFLGLILFCLLPLSGFAQNARLQLTNLEKLSGKALEVNDITLEGDMLQLAVKFMEADHDPDAALVKEMIKGLKGIYVKNFEFDQPNQYSPGDVTDIRVQLAAPGWSKIVENRNIKHAENNEIYVMEDGGKVAGVAILVAEPRELTVVNIVGSIDLDKLSALEGKFGIPSQNERPRRKLSGEASQ